MSITFKNIKIDPDEGKLESSAFDKSDPYVKFYVDTEGWGGETARTSTKDNDLQPDWGDEEVTLEGLGETPMQYTMKIEVFDDDWVGDDTIGTFKLDLATMMPSGSLRLKVDNNIFFSDVFLMVDYETSGWGNQSADAQSITFKNIKVDPDEGQLESDMFDKTDPYVRFYVDTPGWGGEKARTSTKDNDRQPDWGDEEVTLEGLGEFPATNGDLVIDVYDDDLFGDDAVGSAKVNMRTLMASGGSIRVKIDNNIFASDVYLMFDYDTGGWGN